MNPAIWPLRLPIANERSAIFSWGLASVLGLIVAGAGFMGSVPLPIFGWAVAFLFLAVASDVRNERIPNALTLPSLIIAIFLSAKVGSTGGLLESSLGAALGFALLIGPYAIGGLGAGDVKALMVLGAWLGPQELLGATVWAVLIGGALGLVLLAARHELADYMWRWVGIFGVSLASRSLHYKKPAEGSAAAGGLPFAPAIALGLACQWYGGAPW